MKALLIIVATYLLCFPSPNSLMAQEEVKVDIKSFQITVEKLSERSVQLTCSTGCAWKELTFSVQENTMAQGVNQYGMTGHNRNYQVGNEVLANFLFTVKAKKGNLVFKGIKGTVWKDLTFTLQRNKSQKINALGIID